MYKRERKLVETKLKKIFRKGCLTGKRIYLFGVSDNTREIIQILRDYGEEPFGVLDNDPTKQGSYCARVKVLSANDVERIEDNGNVFLVYSYFWKEMTRQLEKLSVKKENIHCLYQRRNLLIVQYGEAYLGRNIYIRIQRKYGDIPVFICPYTGTGDIYLIGTFWKQYLSSEGIEDYVFLVISGACKKVAHIFDIKNVELLKKQEEGMYLIKYYMLCPQKIQLKILNDSWGQIRSNPMQWFRGYKNLYFTELFRKYVFNLPDNALPCKPVLKNADEQIKSIFAHHKLVFGKTVILSPYANTLADLPNTFWNALTHALQEKGYVVCTNSSNEKEPAIKGTVPVFFPLDIAPQFVSSAGYFVGVRSGFCDVISGAEAKKIILYDKSNRFFNSSAFEYFSLNHMGLCSDAIEIEYDNQNIRECLKQIVSRF